MNSKEIRVLQCLASLNLGGAESRMMDIYRILDSDIHFDFLIMQKGEQFFEREIVERGDSQIFKVSRPKNPFINFFEIYKIMKNNGPYAAVHAHTSYHCGLVLLAAFLAGIPIRISHSRTTGSGRSGILYTLRKLIGQFLIMICATDKLAISENAAAFLYGKRWKKCKNTVVLPNAMETESFLQERSAKIDIIKGIGASIKETDTVIGHVGRFSEVKNQKFLIDFMCYLKPTMPNIKLVFIGDGPLRDDIRRKAKEEGLDDAVYFLGKKTDVHKWMRGFSVIIMPSLYEGLCNVLIEAQAAGVPCIASDTIPKETDLGLGLVEYCSLQDGFEKWKNALTTMENADIPSVEDRREALRKNGFCITSAKDYMCSIYRGQSK